MKSVVIWGMLMSASTLTWADVSSSDAKRLSEASTVVRELRAAPDKGIPEDLWNKADCVAVIPGLKKAAFMIGGEFGKGVVSCRSGQTWSAPVFIELQKGSAGFQIGVEQVDLVLLIMNRRGVEKLLENKINLGADASVAAGPVGRAASAGTDGKLTAEILAYSRAKGAFAGINLSGGVVKSTEEDNEDLYGPGVAPRDVVLGTSISAPASTEPFMAALNRAP